MKLDQAVISFLKTYFVSRRGTSHIAGDVLPGGTDTYKLGTSTNRWDTVYARQVIADSLTGGAGADNADTVDGFHASATSTPNTLLPLDGSQAYPYTAYPNALLRDGSRSLTDNLAVTSGKTIDGVDLSEHVINNTHHLAGMAADDHAQYMHITSQRVVSAVHTYNPAVPTPFIVLGFNARNQLIADLRADELNKSVVAGEGLLHGGLLTSDVTLDVDWGAPSGIIIWDSDNEEGTGVRSVREDHLHAVQSSYNPGASASLLRTSVDGELYITGDFGVDGDTLYVDVSEDSVYINAGILPGRRGALTVHPSTTTQKGFVLEQLSGQSANLFVIYDYQGNDLLLISPQGDLESGNPNFVSNLTGWQIEHTGDAEFNNVWIRGGLHASVFVADEMHASGGTLAVLTASKLADTVTLPSVGNTVILQIEGSTATGFSYFAINDILRIKAITSLEPGIDIYNMYFSVASIGSASGDSPPVYPTTCYLRWSFPSATSGKKIPAGTSMVKWGERNGPAGTYTGGMILTSDLNQAPYMDVFTLPADITNWASEPVPTPRVRVGNLDGVLALSEQWGIAFGTDLSDNTKPHAIYSDLQLASHGIEQTWWDIDGNIRGAVDPSAAGQDSLFWLGISETDKKFEVTGDGLLRLTSAAIGPRGGTIFDGGMLWLPFDGNSRLGGIEVNSEYGMFSPSRNYGSMHAAWGKYGSGLSIGGETYNNVYNPNFSRSYSTGWGLLGTGSYFSRSTHPIYVYTGTGSLNIRAGSNNAYGYTLSTMALPAGSTAWGHCMVRLWSGSGAQASIRLYDTTNSAWRGGTIYNTIDGAWEHLQASWYNNTGSTVYIRLYITNHKNDSNMSIRFDAINLHTGSYPKQYTDGDLPGCDWAGTAGNSVSSSVSPNLEYAITTPTNWTVSCWFTPECSASETTYSARIWEWYGGTDDNRIILYQSYGTNTYRILMTKGGSQFYIDSISDHSKYSPHHFVLTYEGADLRWWIDGVEQTKIITTGSYSVTPNEFSVGTDHTGGSAAIGVISDLFVLNHAINADEVAAIYNSPDAVVVLEEFSLRVFEPGDGVTSITPSGLFVREDGNILGVNTKAGSSSVSENTLVIGGVSTGPGDMVLGENVEGKSAIFWDKSVGRFNFMANGIADPFMWIDTSGLTFLHSSGVGAEATSLTWASTGGGAIYSMGVVYDGYDDIFAWYDGGYQGTVVMQFRGGAGGYLEIPALGLNLGSAIGAAPGALRGTGTAIMSIFTVGTNAGIYPQSVVYKYLYSDWTGNKRVYAYYPYSTYITIWNGPSSGDVGATLIDLSDYGVPAGVAAVNVRLIAEDTIGSLTDDLFIVLGPDTVSWQVTARPLGQSLKATNTGITACNSNGDIYYRINAGATMYRYLYILGYFA